MYEMCKIIMVDDKKVLAEAFLYTYIVALRKAEYYFSDIKLATTDHLIRFISKDLEGYVPISVVVTFKKIKALVSGHAQLATILRNSGKLVGFFKQP
uniref:La-related protein 6B n=1 Tax=Tanacetum cinerariifolium TaxID=118510 RepID=A0A6L2NVD5_TANCI|nr:la-related protein 6B [Tanacetum cinerariifolium]